MTSLTTLPWNLVTKNLQVDGLLRKKLRQKITKLEKHLKHFPPDAVQLLVVLERHPKKPLHAAALTLRVPSNILHSEKSAPDVIKAFDDAVKVLLREVESLKSDLRAEKSWKRKNAARNCINSKPRGSPMNPKPKVPALRNTKTSSASFFNGTTRSYCVMRVGTLVTTNSRARFRRTRSRRPISWMKSPTEQ